MCNYEYNPEIYKTKELIRTCKSFNNIFLFCDLHGHSKKLNSFIYGCAQRELSNWTKVRLLPRILAKLTTMFN